MSPSSLVVILSLLVYTASAIPGGWSPIPDIKAPEVREAAEFAVAEHNKSAKLKLGFGSVLSGDQQVVSGMNYRLVIATGDGGKYEAVVWVKPWAHFKQLTSFKKLGA